MMHEFPRVFYYLDLFCFECFFKERERVWKLVNWKGGEGMEEGKAHAVQKSKTFQTKMLPKSCNILHSINFPPSITKQRSRDSSASQRGLMGTSQRRRGLMGASRRR